MNKVLIWVIIICFFVVATAQGISSYRQWHTEQNVNTVNRIIRTGVCAGLERDDCIIALEKRLKGQPGKPGEVGIRGPKGPKGDKGNTGSKGAKGNKGTTGAKGSKGARGLRGKRGPRGYTGNQGVPGTPGHTFTQEELIAAIRIFCAANPTVCQGPKGDKGDKGDPGDSGEPGEPIPPGPPPPNPPPPPGPPPPKPCKPTKKKPCPKPKPVVMTGGQNVSLR